MSPTQIAVEEPALDGRLQQVLATLGAWVGRTVSVRVSDGQTGWHQCGFRSKLTDVSVDSANGALCLKFEAIAGGVNLYGDLVEAVSMDPEAIELTYRGGDVALELHPDADRQEDE